MILNTRTQAISVFLAVALGLSGCHDGSSSATTIATPTPTPAPTPAPSPAPNPTPATYTLGGGVSGLHSGQTLVIQNNGGDTLTLNTAGGFIFPTPLAEGTAYAVTITQQPAFETCTIANGSGTMGSSNITTVSIGCTVNQYQLGGTLSGLITGQETVGLTNTIGSMPPLGLINNGSFNFYGLIAQGTKYNVIVSHQPAGQTCTVSNGSGTVGAGDVTSIGVACVTSGTVTTFAGSRSGAAGQSDGQGTTASFSSPQGIAADANGNLYVADTQNDTIRKITPSGYVSTFAGTVSVPAYADGTGTAAMFHSPSGVATDAQGNVYVADTFNNMIRKITPAGVVTTMAGSTISGQQDGTGSDAGFTAPQGIAVDSSGNVFVADTSNNCIREITPSGAVTTIAGVCGTPGGYTDGPAATARFYAPTGIAVGPNGLLYIADFSNQVIRVLNTTTKTVSTLAGSGTSGYADGNGTAAQFSFPFGLTVGPAGDVYVADNNNYRIRKITPAGVVTTLAGSDTTGSLDGVGTAAQFRGPAGITYNPVTGTLFVVDVNNSNIRQVTR